MSYIKLEIGLHGQSDSVQTLKKRIDELLREYFKPEYPMDLEIEIIEHSSGLACYDCDHHR